MVACAAAMGAGTMAGGVRIIKTMGTKIIDLKPIDGFAAESSRGGDDTGSLAPGHARLDDARAQRSDHGVGSSRRVSAVRWGVTVRIMWAWVLTSPISAGVTSDGKDTQLR